MIFPLFPSIATSFFCVDPLARSSFSNQLNLAHKFDIDVWANLPQEDMCESAWSDWANYTVSPSHPFDNELGAQPP